MMRQRAGYTILEVMIFLAVSALLAAAIFPTWSNRQKNVQFSQAVIDLENKMNDVMNDVSTGYFPGNDFKCFVNGASKIVINPGIGGPSEQGTRSGCIFLGKAVQFNDADGMNIFTVVGKRQGVNGNVESFAESTPTAVAPDSNGGNIPDLTERYTLKWGAHVTNVVTLGSPNAGAYAIAALTPLAKGSSVKAVDVLPITGGFDANRPSYQVAAQINNAAQWSSPQINPPGGMVVCVADADNSKRAVILVGGAAGVGKMKTIFDIENIKSNFGGADPC